MTKKLKINRYNAYYQGWCLSFGEHEANIDDDREIYWLTRNDRIGLAVSPTLRRKFNTSLLGEQGKNAELILDNDSIRVADNIIYPLTDEVDRDGMNDLMTFLCQQSKLYLFLTNHFCYPPGTRIITFCKEKPTILLYKEMPPLKILIE